MYECVRTSPFLGGSQQDRGIRRIPEMARYARSLATFSVF